MADIQRVGVLGCGLMGSGIAQVAASVGYDTIVRDVSKEVLDRGRAGIEKSLAKFVEKGKLQAADRDATLKRLTFTTTVADLKPSDIVIEAITEDLALKNALFKELDGLCGPGTIFASNTSSLTIVEMAAATKRADLPALEPIEHLLQRHLHALVGAAVRAGDQGTSHRHADAWQQHHCLSECERRSDECRCACQPPAEDRQHRAPGDPFGALLADVGLEPHETEARLELHDLRGHLPGLCQRVAASSRQRALNRSECARFGLP